MIVLDKPYTSPELADYLEKTGHPVLRNAEGERIAAKRTLNLLSSADAARRVNAGERLYTVSEHSLDWVLANVHEENVGKGVRGMKNKHRLRETLHPLFPDYFFTEATYEELVRTDPDKLPLPLVLKPVVGFFSVGVHVVNTAEDWKRAVTSITAGREAWRKDYPSEVVANGRFILEEYITGEEYALDAYYNESGRAVIVNVMKHDFASVKDVSDRLYYTGAGVIRSNLQRFRQFLDDVNSRLGLRNFPFHVELRVDGGRIAPIEFNPLRFAGWCCTDLAWFAYGVRTYDHFLNNTAPNWDTLLADKEDDLFSLVILDKRPGVDNTKRFDYDAAGRAFTEVLSQRKIDAPDAPLYGFLFTRTPKAKRSELEAIMRSDLSEYLIG